MIRESWLRSKALGIDPALSRLPEVVSPTHAEESPLHEDLFAIGREVVHRILGILGDPWAAAHLSDREGRALALVLRPRLQEKFAAIQAVPGVGVGENYIGTGAGTAMLINRPLQIRPGEFYCYGWQDFLTHSIPIHDPVSQEVIGAFAISWSGEHTHPRIMNLLRWGQQTIQHELHERQLLDRMHVLQQYEATGHRFPSDALLALDGEGRVIAANARAARMLGQTPHALIGRSVAPNLGLKPAALWNAHPQELALALPQTDRAQIAESLSIERQGRATGGVLVLRSKHGPTKRTPSTQPWQARYTFHDLIGKTPRFQKAMDIARIAATTDLSVLLLGESGTGKELFAQAIHSASPRAAHPFVPFNCGGVTEELIGAELFGYVEGAFTGAVRGGRAGRIEVANGGTLFLDEVDTMPLKMQVSFLRVLEDGVVVPVGSVQPRRVDVRVIAASNQDILQKIAQGSFRADLYYRLSGLTVSLPTLRERQEDLPLLAHHILQQAGLSATLTPETLAWLQRYPWQGNIRELKNVLLRAGALAQGAAIAPQHLFPDLVDAGHAKEQRAALALDPLAQAEKTCITEALAKAQGSVSEAAAQLGIHRITLYRKMRRYGIPKGT